MSCFQNDRRPSETLDNDTTNARLFIVVYDVCFSPKRRVIVAVVVLLSRICDVVYAITEMIKRQMTRAYSSEVDDKRCNGNERGAGRRAPKTG